MAPLGLLLIIGFLLLIRILHRKKQDSGGMGPFEIKIRKGKLEQIGETFFEIEGKGLLPLRNKVNLGFMTLLWDKTNGDTKSVISLHKDFQHPDSTMYQYVVKGGMVSPGMGFGTWQKLGTIIPALLSPPHGGKRKIHVIFYLIDMDNFNMQNREGIVCDYSSSFEFEFIGKGYMDTAADLDEARGISLKMAMAVAMADGHLDDSEGTILREWAAKAIASYTGERRTILKNLYNKSMQEAYEEARNGNLNLDALARRLNEIDDLPTKYQAIELCFDVMSADERADPNEMKVIYSVVDLLGLDSQKIEKIRDRKVLNLNIDIFGQASIEEIIGIKPDWDDIRIQRHLRKEFKKWSDRLQVLEGKEREYAQQKLEAIAEVKRRYD